MILFLVNTSTQLMNAIVLCQTIYKHHKCDIYYTDNLEEYINRLTEHDIFNVCYQIQLPKDALDRKSAISRAVVRVKNAIDIRYIKETIPSDPNLYEKVLLSGQSLRNIEFYYAIKETNKHVRLGLFEEGSFEYCMLGLKKSWAEILFSYLFFHRYYLRDCEDAYVYEPKLVNNIWENIAIKRIPKFTENRELIDVLNNVFSYKHTALDGNRGKAVFLEQAFYDQERDSLQISLINEVIQEFGSNNVFVKLHPRSRNDKYNLSPNSVLDGTPLELMVLNEDIADNIFISITSSATTNFKVIFDIEPHVIMLYKLFPSHNVVSNENEDFIMRVKKRCNANTFFIPTSIGDFKKLLRDLMKTDE